jgi:hypothetical protein
MTETIGGGALGVADVIGSIGVLLLLLAFALNLSGALGYSSRAYQSLNAIGAGLAATASYWIGFWPFVVLEGTWMAVAVVALLRRQRDDQVS